MKFSLLTILALFFMNSPLVADNLDALHRQLRENPPPVPVVSGDISVHEALATLRADGTWADLDYTDGTSYRIYPTSAHLRRANLIMDSAAGAEPAERERRRRAAHQALSVWLRLDPQTNQNWFQSIGVPQWVGRLLLEFSDEVTPAEKKIALSILRRCVSADGELIYSGQPATGQNLQWQAALQIVGACLERDAARVEHHVRRIEREMQITTAEGIQVDLSFHQHGSQLYSGGYGQSFIGDAARLAVQTGGTRFALKPESVELLTRFLLDGQQAMLRGRRWDFTAIGREIARENRDASPLAGAADHLASLGGPRSDELRSFARRLRGEESPEGAPAGFRVFWRSDFVSQTRPAFHFAVRITSTRMGGSESGNGENESGTYLGDGATTLMRTGDEYHGVFPLWDWRRIPGVTNAYQPDVPLPFHDWNQGFASDSAYAPGSSFAGGAGDGRDGLAAMTLDRLGVHAAKAWFFQGDTVVCLGAGIRAVDPAAPLATTLEQCWARGEVTRGDTWARHNGVTYHQLGDGILHADTTRRTGTWRTLDRLQGSTRTVEGDVFTAWIEHVAAPAAYAYRIDIGEAGAAPHVLANTENIQAVASAAGDLVQMVFRAPGEMRLPDGLSICADQPCFVQLRRPVGATSWTLTAGNPTHRVGDVRITLAIASDSKTTTFSFPDSPLAGQPQTRTLARP
ncbi:MAG: hypothetical protein H7067_15210 [Burkholderiales bacterium]|nr:hypothetical protein [Opitutaceae bacterium]